MYPYEDRVRAVRLYIKLGKRVAATICQLGYLTKNSLKSWHQEHEQRLDLHTGYARAPKYSQAQKKEAVNENVENLILENLKRFQAGQDRIERKIDEHTQRLGRIEVAIASVSRAGSAARSSG